MRVQTNKRLIDYCFWRYRESRDLNRRIADYDKCAWGDCCDDSVSVYTANGYINSLYNTNGRHSEYRSNGAYKRVYRYYNIVCVQSITFLYFNQQNSDRFMLDYCD